MALGRTRSGAPVTGTQAVAGTDGSLTAPRLITFNTPVRPCIVTHHGQNDELLIKVNVELKDATSITDDFSTGATGKGMFVLPPKVTLADASKDPPEGGECYVDVSLGGLIAVHSVSIATVNSSDDLDDVSVVGWQP